MEIVIDQRRIPDLLVNCANAPVPIEVVRFRMFEPLTSGHNRAPAPAAGGGGGFGRAPGLLGDAPGAPMQRNQNAGGKADDVEAGPFDVTVEVCGLVQIFNMPDEMKLASGGATDPGKGPSAVPTTMVNAPRGGSTGGAPPGMGGGRGRP